MKDKREYFTPSQLEALKISLFPVKPEVLLIKSELYEILRNVFFSLISYCNAVNSGLYLRYL